MKCWTHLQRSFVQTGNPMVEMTGAIVVWLGTHLGMSSTPLRNLLVTRIGEGLYLLVYSLVAALSFGLLIWVYATTPRFDYFWTPNPDLYWVAKITMPIALILLFGGCAPDHHHGIAQKAFDSTVFFHGYLNQFRQKIVDEVDNSFRRMAFR